MPIPHMVQPTPDNHYSHFFDISITFTLIHPFYKHSHWLTGIGIHQNAMLLHTKQMKSIPVHARQMKSLPVHTKQTKWVSVHTTTLNPPHTRTFIPEDGFRKKLAKQTYLTLLTTLLQFQGYESLCQSVCKLTILTYRSFTLYLNAEK